MKHTGHIFIFVLLALVSCTKEQALPEGEAVAVAFCTCGDGTKSAFNTEDVLKTNGFVVSANIREYEGASSSKPFIKYQSVSWSSDQWTYSPVKYWPTDGSSVLDFYPVYTDGSENITLRYDWYNKPQISYSLNSKVSSQSDLLWAPPVLGVKYEDMQDGAVHVDFHHAMSTMLFSICLGEDFPGMSFTVTSVSVTGSFHLKAEIIPDKTDINEIFKFRELPQQKSFTISSWDTGELSSECKAFTNDFVSTDGDGFADITGNKGAMMFFPCKGQVYTLTLEYTVSDGIHEESHSVSFTDRTMDLLPGVAYTTRFTLNSDDVNVKTVTTSGLDALAGEEL